jgi:hypothetical protein
MGRIRFLAGLLSIPPSQRRSLEIFLEENAASPIPLQRLNISPLSSLSFIFWEIFLYATLKFKI